MAFSPLIEQLINALRCLPGVGPKSAQRMAFHLLERNRDGGEHLSLMLKQAIMNVKHCQQCRTLCETDLCNICSHPKRNRTLLCIVENPMDILAIEQTVGFNGVYFVLLGHLSPLDGIGPNDIGMPELKTRLSENTIEEIILATNPTVEGEATAHYIAELAKPYSIHTTRIAHGVPLGGELEYIDSGTLAHALLTRVNYETETP